MNEPMYSKNNFDESGQFKIINWDEQPTQNHWFNSMPVLTYLANTYIILTGEVERFSISAAKSILPEIQDKELKQELCSGQVFLATRL